MHRSMAVIAAAAAAAGASAAGPGCAFCTPSSPGSKLTYDLSGLPSDTFTLTDSADDTYYVGSPCKALTPTKAQCASVEYKSSAYQANTEYGCLPLGNISQSEGQPLSWADEGAGLHLVQRGGTNNPECGGGRVVVYRGICDKTVPASNPPNQTVVENPRCTYTVAWSNPAFCPVKSSGDCPSGPNTLPKPTPEQLQWQRYEIGGLTHFNMATFAHVDGDPACSVLNWNVGRNTSNPNTFAPTNLNISNWVESYEALGAGYAVLTAKHGCGFLLFDTASKLPARLGGGDYNFAVKRSGVPSYPRDVAGEFVKTVSAAGMGTGFYYSTTNNFYTGYVGGKQLPVLLPGQLNITTDEFNDIVFAQLQELWGNYGKFTEVWLDHGYTGSQQQRLETLLADKQPQALAFNGLGVSANPCRWVGTESGLPSYPIWSTGTSNGGDPDSAVWNPANSDTTLQTGDHWFYLDGVALRPLSTLVDVYHATVGANTVLELDFAIDTTGNVHPAHAQAYKALGDWIRACYGKPVAGTSGSGAVFNLTMPGGSATVDRVVIGEDQTYGQRVRSFVVDALGADGKWTTLSTGSSIGHKRIAIAKAPVTASVVRLTINGAVAEPILTGFAAYAPCAVPSE